MVLTLVNDNKSYLFGLVFYLDNEVKYCFQNFEVIHITMQVCCLLLFLFIGIPLPCFKKVILVFKRVVIWVNCIYG
ncbi:hypothetical protein ACB092_09G198800 [Castanea dentata]